MYHYNYPMYHMIGGGTCTLCGSPGTNKSTCPLNPDAKKPNPSKHPMAGAVVSQPIPSVVEKQASLPLQPIETKKNSQPKKTKVIYDEGGANVTWYTELEHDGKEVTILRHYRVHNDDEGHPEGAIHHPKYYGSDIWKEGENRIAIAYYIPDIGWLPISNPAYIFSYK